VSRHKPEADSPPAEAYFWRRAAGLALAALSPLACTAQPAAAEPLRVCVIAGAGTSPPETRRAIGGLSDFLEKGGLLKCSTQVMQDSADSDAAWGALAASRVAVLWVSGCRLGDQGKSALQKFLEEGGGLVVVGAGGGCWSDWPQFEPDVLGARFGARFAGGLPMRVINLFPHPIFSGVDHFDTAQSMLGCGLARDDQVIMEGTVGEETVPMGWVRRHLKSRVVCLQPGGAFILGDPQFRAMVSNGVLWAARQPVPRAITLIQRTSMADAFPGALAITFPGGPSLCFDTVRGGINYIWDGDFVDLHPWWTGRHGDPLRTFAARISGEVFYRDGSMSLALHVGSSSDPSVYHFRGYRLGKDGFPELLYSVGGTGVTEELRPVGDGAGVECTFHVEAGPRPLWMRLPTGSKAEVGVSGAVRDGDFVRYDATGAGTFAVTFRGRGALAP
jgi:hypothetical protein